MGLFDKKECCICGEKIGLLGNKKLEDGDMCKHCAGKLSRWFTERKHSTRAEILEQLAYREENRKAVAAFNPSVCYGYENVIYIDDKANKFFVTKSKDYRNSNPDVLDGSQILDASFDVRDSRTELYHNDNHGNRIPYNPPQFRYTFTFYITIRVNHPYFSEMRFQPLEHSVVCEPRHSDLADIARHDAHMSHSPLGHAVQGMFGPHYDPTMEPQYQDAYYMCEEVVGRLLAMRDR